MLYSGPHCLLGIQSEIPECLPEILDSTKADLYCISTTGPRRRASKLLTGGDYMQYAFAGQRDDSLPRKGGEVWHEISPCDS